MGPWLKRFMLGYEERIRVSQISLTSRLATRLCNESIRDKWITVNSLFTHNTDLQLNQTHTEDRLDWPADPLYTSSCILKLTSGLDEEVSLRLEVKGPLIQEEPEFFEYIWIRPMTYGFPIDSILNLSLKSEKNGMRIYLSIELQMSFNDERQVVIGLECGDLSGLLIDWGELHVEELK